MVSKRRFGFATAPIYRRREPHAFRYLSERVTFWVAILSVFAFVTGNMIGQNGWSVFWKSVMGAGQEVQYAGFVTPLAQVPDFKCWSSYGGSIREHAFRQIPKDCLVPMPTYTPADAGQKPTGPRIYLTEPAGSYDSTKNPDLGSHPGHDIAAPEGTPVRSVANGIVHRTGNDAGGFGLFIVVEHPNVPEYGTLFSVYAHLSAIGVSEGETVLKGQDIGATGSTGNASAPHLHFQMDRKEAPWHPYWPFSYTEARQAGMSFTQAVNNGLFRQRLLDYTVNPMLYIQAHVNDQPTVVAKPEEKPAPKRLTKDDRLRARMAKWNLDEKPTVTWVPAPAPAPATTPPPPVVVKTETVVSTAPAVALPVSQTVASARLRHDGYFSSERAREKLTITLLDAEGDTVTSPTLPRSLELRTVYGRAEFFPATLNARNFRDGVATVEMLPLGQTTVVVVVQPLGSQSEPMRFER